MEAALDNILRLAKLALPALLGAIARRAAIFPDPDRAVTALNTYAITVAFPALIARGLLAAELALPDELAFYLVWPLSLLTTLAVARAMSATLSALAEDAGTLALVISFGNVAYLGLPYTEAVLGAPGAGAAALAVSIHVAFAVTVGPALLERWSGGRAEGITATARRLLRMPLFWAPFLGLAGRWLPAAARAEVVDWISPLASSAAPVALFLLGLYLYGMRRHLRRVDLALGGHLAARQLIAPLAALGLGMLGVRAGLLSPIEAQVHIILAGMPVAITTFSMAHQAGQGSERVAAAIVWSSALAMLLLPAWTAIAQALFPAPS